jgi:hypothetical protein
MIREANNGFLSLFKKNTKSIAIIVIHSILKLNTRRVPDLNFPNYFEYCAFIASTKV